MGCYIALDTLAMVVRTYSALPFWDQWDTVADYQVFRHGNFTLAHLLAQHNEHRLAFPRLIFLADYGKAAGSNWFDLAVIYLVQLVHAGLLIGLMRPRWRQASTWIVAAVVLGLMMSIGQWENFTWGFQTQFVGVFALATGAFVLLARAAERDDEPHRPLVAFLGALLLFLLATFSMANGLVAAAIGVALCCLLRAPRWMALSLAGLTLIAGALYFHGYVPAERTSPAGYALAHPLALIEYGLSYLGNPIGEDALWRADVTGPPVVYPAPMLLGALAAALGIAAIVLTAFRRGADREQAVLAAVILFIFVSAAMTALGRLDLGIWQAYSSRYRTPTGILWAVLIVFWSRSAIVPPAWAKAGGMAVSTGVLALMLCVQHVVKPGLMARAADLHLAENSLLAGVADINALGATYPGSSELLTRVEVLRDYHKSIFSAPRAAWVGRPLTAVTRPAAGRCIGAFDIVRSSPLSEIEAVRAYGWAWDTKGRRPIRHIVLTNDKMTIVGFGVSGSRRQDVRQALGHADGLYAGWEGSARARGGVLHAFALLPGNLACELGSRPVAILPPATPVEPLAPLERLQPLAAAVTADPTWTIGGQPSSAAAPPGDALAYVSWSGADHNTGVINFGPFRAPDGSLAVKIITGPDVSRQSVILRDERTGVALSAFEPGLYGAWTWLRLGVPPGRAVVLQALDEGSGWGQWLGLSVPYAVAKRPAPPTAPAATATGR